MFIRCVSILFITRGKSKEIQIDIFNMWTYKENAVFFIILIFTGMFEIGLEGKRYCMGYTSISIISKWSWSRLFWFTSGFNSRSTIEPSYVSISYVTAYEVNNFWFLSLAQQGMSGLLICSYDGMLFQLYQICCSIVVESYSLLQHLVVGTCQRKLAAGTYVMWIEEIFLR